MKRLSLLLLFFSSVIIAIAQERKELDFVIVVDDEFGGIATPLHISLKKDNGETENINFNYHPGCLSLDMDDYNKLKTFAGKIELHFGWYKHMNGETRHYFYDIPFDPFEKKLFEASFVVIKIYNLDDKKYKKLYYPLEGKNYNFSLYTSEGIRGLLTKKEIKMLKRKKLWPTDQK